MAKTLFIEDSLISMLQHYFGWQWVDDVKESTPYLIDKDGNVVHYDDYEMLEIPKITLKLENGEEYICDGVLLFGDGCMEFHDAKIFDALHWDYFTDESILKITEIIKEIVGN